MTRNRPSRVAADAITIFETLMIQTAAVSVLPGVMKISRRSRLATQALLELTRLSRGECMSLTEMATRRFVSKSYLEHLFVPLRRDGLVSGVRGTGGGYRLARPASEISLADIIFSVEELLPLADANGGDSGRSHDPVWPELTRQIYEFLDGISLADLSKANLKAIDRGSHATERLSGIHA